MTVYQDAQKLIDEATAEGHLTTVGFVNTHWKTPPAGTHWAAHDAKLLAARKLLDPAAPPPPPPPPSGQRVNTNGADNITVANQSIVVPVEYTDYNIACVYVSGDSKNTRLGPNLSLDGAFLGVKQYGPANGLVIDGVEISGAGGDATHFDQGVNVRMDNTHIFRPPSQGGEHHDAVQIQAGSGYYFGPGCLFEWPVDYPEITGEKGGSGMFINQSGPFLFDVTIDRVRIHGPKHANALQMMCGGTIISPTIEGPPAEKITLNRPPDGRKIILRSAATGMWANGVRRADVYCNDFQGAGWPDYVQVDP